MLLSSAASLLWAPSASAASGTSFGFNEWNVPGDPQQAELNMPVRRISVGWNAVQPTPTTWNWSQLDSVYARASADGLKPLLLVSSAPCWANSTVSCSGVLPPDPSHYADWSNFITQLASRYPGAIGVEVWNEENRVDQWRPSPDPTAYTQLLQLAYRAVKNVDPTMPVISGGLQASPVSGTFGMGDAQFLSGMYAAGAKGYMNGIGVHPYPVAATWVNGILNQTFDVSVMEQTLNRMRSIRNAAGDSVPMWITEMGVSTQSNPGFPTGVSESQQARDLLTMIAQVKVDPDVAVALIHHVQDWATATGTDGYGVFNRDGTPKLAACQLSLYFGGTLHCPGVTPMQIAPASGSTTSSTAGKLRPNGLGIRAMRKKAHSYGFTGRLELPTGVNRKQGCVGTVLVVVKHGRTIGRHRAKLSSKCTYNTTVRSSGALLAHAVFQGNPILTPTSSKTITG